MAIRLRTRSLTLLLAAVVSLVPFMAWAQGLTQVVAISGMTPPEGNGTFRTFDVPVLNNLGQTAFRAHLDGTAGSWLDDTGLYRGDASGGSLSLIAREHDRTLHGAGINFLENPAINNLGQLAFRATYLQPESQGGLSIPRVYVGSAGTPLTTIVSRHQPAPDGNGFFDYFENPGARNPFIEQLAFNDAGQVGFKAWITGTSHGSYDDEGIFRGDGQNLIQVAREKPASVTQPGLKYLGYPAIDDHGSLAFPATFIQSTIAGGAPFRNLYRGTGGALTLIAGEGWPAPDGNGLFDGEFWGFDSPALSPTGQAAFVAGLRETPDSHGIFRGSGGPIVKIVRMGETAPQGGGTFSGVLFPAVDSSGRVAFKAVIEGTPPEHDEGIFLRDASGIVLPIVRKGVEMEGIGTPSFIGLELGLNDLGQVAFNAHVGGKSGIFLGNGIDFLEVARTGQPLAGDTIESLEWLGNARHGGGENSGMNDFGPFTFLAYRTDLQDGRQAIVRYRVVSPRWVTTGSSHWAEVQNWSPGVVPNSFHDAQIQPGADTIIIGPHDDEYVKSLTIGADFGEAELRVHNGGNFTALDRINLHEGGRIHVGQRHILAAPAISNGGVLTGDGIIATRLTNEMTGQLRVAPSNRLQVAGGPHTNYGQFEVTGGALEFAGPVNNMISGDIGVSGDGRLRFNTGFVNQGQLTLGWGTNRVSGDVENLGRILVRENSRAIFDGVVINDRILDVAHDSMAIFNSEFVGRGVQGGGPVYLQGRTRPGLPIGEMDFGGDVVFGAFSQLDLELGGVAAGEYDTVDVAGGAMIADGITLNVLPWKDFVPSPGDEFVVLKWQNGLAGMFTDLTVDSFFTDRGIGFVPEYVNPGGVGWLTLWAVPEPAALGLAVLGLVLIAASRGKRKFGERANPNLSWCLPSRRGAVWQ